ncbi:aldehyde dehydrogenase (NADP(+)) [Galbitalea soli]|uniref:Aldehyde dehydrogenase (NADP(+)) n=1 Tax=Galbitalea soli TaxID=1268042 RepID=A0A7C9PMK7_9MICO|nr:aldehyde dehydrogenase (NADP(+)) [Galbitalea soli]NEM91033.1 aldehyde dehydrogenase (NADP(+)) [Galbitalea soli]NYJ29721.1 NADP-dependent aldehyde dehydrogenase [Galbitalea soli]
MTITTTDPATGVTSDTGIEATTEAELARITEAAASAFTALRGYSRAWRAGLLRALADGLEERRGELVAIAHAETGLAETPRLNGELSRSAYQLRLFAEAVEEGGYLEAVIDHAGDTPLGPGPEIRRMLVPLGPVAVFGASNFPFAFSVAGGDTASALAAGNPVVAKAHPSHPLTSRASFDALRTAAEGYGAPAGILGLVYGQEAGAALVADPRVAAVGFTGSLATGRILLDIIETRERPVPFYGELSSLNPLIVSAGAVAARAGAIADGLFASFTGSAGQLCTKPGLAFLPRSATALVDAIVARAAAAEPQPLLNARIHDAFGAIRGRLLADGGADSLVEPHDGPAGITCSPAVLAIDASRVTAAVAEEAFGPLLVLALYDDPAEIAPALAQVPDSLTATVHAEPDEWDDLAPLLAELEATVGRLVFNGYPTGVRVSWGQHHGGPWPATNSVHSSVGVSAIRRFLRPVAWQDAPATLLPEELREDYTGIPRRVDGVLTLATLGE